jgi:hypothetical protein
LVRGVNEEEVPYKAGEKHHNFGVVCDEHGIGGGGKYSGDNDAQLGRINFFLPRGLGRQLRSPRGANGPRERHD